MKNSEANCHFRVLSFRVVGDIGLLLPYKYRIKIQRPQKGRRLGRHLGHD